MMYDFRSPEEHAFPERLSVQTIIDGVNLDDMIEGFRTLSVKGRELNAKDISTQTHQIVRGGGGSRTKSRNTAFVTNYDSSFIGSRVTDKTITVEYDLRASSNEEFRQKFELLNFYLRGEEVPAIFTDDMGFYYDVTLGGAKEVDGGGNWVRSNFELVCSNPFKRSVVPEVLHFTTRADFKKHVLYPVYLEDARIALKGDANKIILKNETTGKRIILDGAFKSGDEIIIDFIRGMVHTGRGESLMKALDITSHLESFSLSYGDVLSVTASGDVYVTYREVRL